MLKRSLLKKNLRKIQRILTGVDETVIVKLNILQVPITNVSNLEEQPFKESKRAKATVDEIINCLKEISRGHTVLRDQIITITVQSGSFVQEPGKLADFAAAMTSAEPKELQEILESLVIEERLGKALFVLKKELANAKLQQEISQEVNKKINRKNQEFYLMEQLKGIKKELGMESDGKEKMIQAFKDKAIKLVMPDHIKVVFDEEIQKLSTLERKLVSLLSLEIIWIGLSDTLGSKITGEFQCFYCEGYPR